MKNWLIEKLGGVSKKDHEEVIQAANRLAIGFVEWVAKKVRNQDDDWGGHWPY